MNVLTHLVRLARALDAYPKDKNPEHWKTINGAHVHVDKNGNYDGGAGGKFTGRHHYGPDWRQKSALMNRLSAALHGGVSQGQAQGNTAGQNVASKATMVGTSGQSLPAGITIKTEVKGTDFPPEYNAASKKAALKVVVNTLNGIRDKDPAIFHLYSNMGKIAQACNAKVKLIHSVKRGQVSACAAYGFSLDVRVRNVVQKEDGPNTRRKSLATWFHENMHFMDYAIGQQSNTSRWRVKAASGECTNLTNAISNASQSPRPSSEIGDWLKEARKKEIDADKKAWDVRSKRFAELSAKRPTMSAYEYMQEYDKITKDYADMLKREEEKAKEGDLAFYGNLSDLYDALAGGEYRDIGLDGVKIPGHGVSYYSKHGAKEVEMLANWGALRVMAPNLADKFRNDKPEVAKALDELIIEMCKQV